MVIMNTSDKAREFLISKGIIAPDKSEFAITFTDGRQVIVNDLLVEFAESLAEPKRDSPPPPPPGMEISEWFGIRRPADQWGVND